MRVSRRQWLVGATSSVVVGLGALAAPKVARRMEMQGMRPVTVAKGLEMPWSLAFMPDGRMLVIERPGRMRMVGLDGSVGPALKGLPPVFAQGEGGLMDVALHPEFARNGQLYWTFSEPALNGAPGAGTSVARARLEGSSLVDVQIIWRQSKVDDVLHFGSRLLFAPDGHLFVSLGDRSQRMSAQRLDTGLGKILRIDAEGRAPASNPFVGVAGALPEIWSYGHRNVQGLAWRPQTDELWATEHGPQGGDELNVIQPGRNYGWPVITYGTEYDTGAKIGEGTEKAGMESPVHWWGPTSVAPCGLVFLTSDRYPDWTGQLFMGTLRGHALTRLKLSGRQLVEQQRLATGLLERIRDVREGPDGWLYVLTHNADGRIIRMER